ncbi:hypothetical protein GCM10009624_33610 [Gordonia sinesedis]
MESVQLKRAVSGVVTVCRVFSVAETTDDVVVSVTRCASDRLGVPAASRRGSDPAVVTVTAAGGMGIRLTSELPDVEVVVQPADGVLDDDEAPSLPVPSPVPHAVSSNITASAGIDARTRDPGTVRPERGPEQRAATGWDGDTAASVLHASGMMEAWMMKR